MTDLTRGSIGQATLRLLLLRREFGRKLPVAEGFVAA